MLSRENFVKLSFISDRKQWCILLSLLYPELCSSDGWDGIQVTDSDWDGHMPAHTP